MPVEIVGQQLRFRVRSPKGATDWGTHDVGRKGHLQRLSGYYPRTGWRTQSWRFNLADYKDFDDIEETFDYLLAGTKSGLTKNQIRQGRKLAAKWWRKHKV